MPHKRKDLNITGPNLWYLVGLITSDGNLSKDGRHVDITANDIQYLSMLKEALGLSNKIGDKHGSGGRISHHIQLANRQFYDFLVSVGLMPRKSLTLKALKIEEFYFHDFLRGLIDGDGSMRRWYHPKNGNQQWSLRVYSGSRDFMEWLEKRIKELYKVDGRLHKDGQKKSLYVLKYGKMAAREILKKCYYDGAFALGRKAALARSCINSYKGWSKSKTVFA
jgi:hypothetical protein